MHRAHVRRRLVPSLIALGLLGTVAAPATAAEGVDLDIGAQYRPRFELNEKSLGDNRAASGVSHRARLDVGLSTGGWEVRMQPQHVLNWGSENTDPALGPTGSLSLESGDFDMHQAYVGVVWGEGFWVRIGRQEVNYQDQRLLGAVDWTQQGRAFDAVRLGYARGDTWHADTLIAILHEGGSYDQVLHAAQAGGKFGDLALTGLVLVEHSRVRMDGKTDYVRATPGLRGVLEIGDVSLEAAAYLQAGGYTAGTADVDVLAYAVAAAGSYKTSALTLLGGLDWLSGDDDLTDADMHTFDTLYATNHKFYGHMDYFLNIPLHTGGLGLGDAYAGVGGISLGPVKAGATAHTFLAAVESAAGNRLFGGELDTNLAYKPHPAVTLVGGYGLFVAGEAFVDIGRAPDAGNLGHWLWLQMDVNL